MPIASSDRSTHMLFLYRYNSCNVPVKNIVSKWILRTVCAFIRSGEVLLQPPRRGVCTVESVRVRDVVQAGLVVRHSPLSRFFYFDDKIEGAGTLAMTIG